MLVLLKAGNPCELRVASFFVYGSFQIITSVIQFKKKNQKIIKFTITSKPLWLLACMATEKNISIPCQTMQKKFDKFCSMKSETLLTRFIREKLNSHQIQPTTGFSDRKYIAVLSMLTGFSIKFRAEKLNISYNTYRRWATEVIFKRIALEFIDEFASLVIRHVREKATNCSYEDFANLDWSGILDANSYSKPLKKRIGALYLKEGKTLQDKRFIFAMCSILNHAGNISEKVFKQIRNDIENSNKAALKLLFMSAQAVTQKYSLNVKDKNFLRQILSISERLIFQ